MKTPLDIRDIASIAATSSVAANIEEAHNTKRPALG
jgi:hypothetical protein